MSDKEGVNVKGFSEASSSLKAAIVSEFTDVEESEPQETEHSDMSENEVKGESGISGVGQVKEEQPNLEGDRATLFYFELADVTKKTPFVPEDRDKTFPVRGSGQIDSIIIQSQSNLFSATLEVDGNRLLDGDSWDSINTITQELPHIGAYQTSSGIYVLSISDYIFNEQVDLSLRPDGEVTFDGIRVEIMIDELNEED